MKTRRLWIVGFFVMSWTFGGWVLADDRSCGDEGLTCGDEERCCEHVMAFFTDSGASSPSYIEGRCIPKEQKCSDYWCGNRHCSSGFFGMQSVCCVNNDPSHTAQYHCAYSELSCPGNTQQLTIRGKQVASSRTLQTD